MSITRRLFLRSTAAVTVAITAPAADAATAAPTEATPSEKIDALAAQLALAMKEAYPGILFYDVDHEHGLVICALGMKRGIRIGVEP